MASATSSQRPDLPSNTPRGPDRPGVPLRSTSQNYIDAQASRNAPPPPSASSGVSIPDGRRGSDGRVITSPVESWKPDFKRKQSYNQEELKRELMITKPGLAEKEGGGQGFTEEGGKA